jgi:signal transduction histidine kinase
MLESDENQSYREYDVEIPGHRKLSLGVTISSIHDYTSSKVGVSILTNDLTEIKNLRGEVEARNRLVALGEMASGLAHQLRNSMGAITGYSHLVKKRLTKHGLDLDSITALEDEAREADLLVDRFLSFARPFDLAAGQTDVTALVADLMETFKVRRENALIEFAVADEMPPGWHAQVDALLIKQALANLIENAVNSYEGCAGTVKVGLSVQSGFVTIQVSDNGCGIAEEDLEKIFTPFFSSRPSGTGLGLPLAKKIIDLHHGRLTVSSLPASGTTFTVTLPLHQSNQRLSSREPASRQV